MNLIFATIARMTQILAGADLLTIVLVSISILPKNVLAMKPASKSIVMGMIGRMTNENYLPM
jgi:hypothetical protein